MAVTLHPGRKESTRRALSIAALARLHHSSASPRGQRRQMNGNFFRDP